MNFPHEYDLPKKHHHEMTQWCLENFGPRWEVTGNREGTWCVFWNGFRTQMPGSYRWSFKNIEDATLFLLRWA